MDVVELEVRPRSGGSMHGIEGCLASVEIWGLRIGFEVGDW